MTHSSIGSGANADGNENHPADGLPGKTMGEQAQAAPAASGQTAPAPADGATEDELASPQEILKPMSEDAAGDNPGNFPDGPNVAPSPWEKEAAQGEG